jgi:hypothetical protein
MVAILEAYASDDRRHVDYARITASEEFRRYVYYDRKLVLCLRCNYSFIHVVINIVNQFACRSDL